MNKKTNYKKGGNLNNLTDQDDATELIVNYHNPPDGKFERYWSNGNKRYEWEYKNGKRVDGISRGWYDDGKLKSIRTFKNGKRNGLQIEWYENGKKKFEETWKDNKLTGTSKTWFYSGRKEREANYKDDKLDGLYTEWDVQGNLIKQETYHKGDSNASNNNL